MRIPITLIVLIVATGLCAQRYSAITKVKVNKGNQLLHNAWCGGFNNPVISAFDMNQDGRKDLYIYDKASGLSHVYLNKGTVGKPLFVYAPQYDSIFPMDLVGWVLMRDFNSDRVPDLFFNNQPLTTANPTFVGCYRGRVANGVYHFDFIKNAPKPIYFSPPGLLTSRDFLPDFYDVNGDGDMDIITWDASSGQIIQYYENQSMELPISKDSLYFDHGQNCWGYFNKNLVYNFIESNTSCKRSLRQPGTPESEGILRHASGGTLYAFDSDSDGLTDVICGDSKTSQATFYHNQGSKQNASITDYDTLYPKYSETIQLPYFTATYGADVDNDGRDDLLVAPFQALQFQSSVEDVHCMQYYHNRALTGSNRFDYSSDTLFSSTTIDVGSYSTPRYVDVNRDGLMDIVIGNYNAYHSDSTPIGKLTYILNTGTATTPAFTWQSDDWCYWSAFGLHGVQPAFGDIDGDSLPDAIVGDSSGYVYFFKNSGSATIPYPSISAFPYCSLYVGSHATPYLYDVNGDSLLDILIGGQDGRIAYFRNTGTRTAPLFSMSQANMNFGNIRINDRTHRGMEGYSAPVVVKEGGKLMLYSGSQRGYIFKYEISPDSLSGGTFKLMDSMVTGYNGGINSVVDIADLNRDGYPDYLIGNVSGGISLYSSHYWADSTYIALGIADEDVASASLIIYPNPTSDKVHIAVQGEHLHIESVTFTIMYGVEVGVYHLHQNVEMMTFDTGGLSAGIYMVTILLSDGSVINRKLSIIR